MRTSGLVLDVYDDFAGETLRALYPSPDSIPDGVKQATPLTSLDRESLPDDVFALVLLNDGEKLRKYACIDEGNTVLSVAYFLKHAHKLPTEAQKVAAANLQTACGWYDVEAPEALQKIALGLGTAMTALTAVPIIKGTHQAVKENMGATRALESQGAGIVTPQMRNAALGKVAELSGTPDMPAQPPSDFKPTPSKAVITKTASMGRLVPGHRGEQGSFGPEETERYDGYTHGKTPPRFPQAGHLQPAVDVSKRHPPRRATEKKASVYALPTQQKYPLDSYEQVKCASTYFDEYCGHMAPSMRREFASNLVPRADDLLISVSDGARKYGSAQFAPDHEIKAAFDIRRNELSDQPEVLALLGQVEKVARFRMWKNADGEKIASATTPDVVVALLEEFDKAAGFDHNYDRGIPDPYYSIYGLEKSAEDSAAWSDLIDNAYVTARDLKRLAKAGTITLQKIFGEEFRNEFRKDPVGIYKSLPRDQKKILINMATDPQPGPFA